MSILRPHRVTHLHAAVCAFLALAFVPFVSWPAAAQQNSGFRHLDPQGMSTADRAVVQSRGSEINEAARIYGYNLAVGDWIYRQTICTPLPNTILLHYSERFPDGTESLFTALVPRGSGRVRIVPVLYRNATPFVPAPRNPRNYALFNSLVPQSIASQDLASRGNWLELGACYAEMTGADIKIPRGGSIEAGVAEAPTATIHIDPKHKFSLITFADRESTGTFRVWSVSFNRSGRVTDAGTQVYPVYPMKPTAPQPEIAAQAPESAGAAPASEPAQASMPVQPLPESHPSAPLATASASTAVSVSTAPTPKYAAPASAAAQTSQSEVTRPGWVFVPEAPQPSSEFIPSAPQPPSEIEQPPPNR